MRASGRRLPMFPLSTVVFPATRIPLHVFEPRYQALVADCLSGDRSLGIVLISRGPEVGGGEERVDVGSLAHIESARPLPEGRWHLVVDAVERIRVTAWHPDDPYPVATVEAWHASTGPPSGGLLDAAEAEVRRVRAILSELGTDSTVPPGHLVGDEPESIAWRLCALAPLGPLDRQRLLAAPGHDERMTLLLTLVRAVGQDATQLLGGG